MSLDGVTILTIPRIVDPHEKALPMTSTEKIFDYLYKVRIPYQLSRSVEDLEVNGTIVSGDRDFDRDIENHLLTRMMSINIMIECYKRGIPIYVVKYEDTKHIYDAISEHLQLWKERLHRGINIGNAPIEDLVTLDHFANVVYEHAKYQFNGDVIDNLIAQRMSGLQRVNVQNFFSRAVPLKGSGTEDSSQSGTTFIGGKDEDIPERADMADFFRSKLIMNRRPSGNYS